jgi:hypothetical protein
MCLRRVRQRREREPNIGHPVTGLDAEPLQRRRPAVTPLEKLAIAEPQVSIDNRFPIRVQSAGAPRKFHRGQCNFHFLLLETIDERSCFSKFQCRLR